MAGKEKSFMERTTKEKVLTMLEHVNDDITFDELIYKLEFMKAVEQGIREADAGMLIDDEEVWAELEAEDAADEAEVDSNGSQRSPRRPRVHRAARGTNKRTHVSAKNQGRRKKS
jgi:hypothetical protein